MTLRVFLSVAEIGILVGVLAFFLNLVARQLNRISTTLAKVTFGVRAVEVQCAVIGPAVDRINGNLADTASGLTDAASQAERLAR